jgi:hypothetical protein
MAANPRRPRSSASSRSSAPSREGFELPPEMGPAGAASLPEPSGEFEPPPGEAPGDDTAFAEAAEGDSELQQMKHEVEKMLFARVAETGVQALSAGPPDRLGLIAGVGIGAARFDFESVGPGGPGAPVLNVYVVEPMSMDEVKGLIVDSFGVRALSTDSRPVNVIHTGPIDAYAHRHRERGSPCGISVGHRDITAGTQGVLARGRSGPRRNRLLLLSNNHVLANVNAAQAGDPIYQPGPDDLPRGPANQIGILEQWVPINFGSSTNNYVDCATAWCWPDRVRHEFIFRRGGQWDYFKVEPTPVTAVRDMAVGKSGRTTQLTTGQIIGISESIPVNMGGGRVANFSDQISVRGNGSTLFSRGGDSGSLIWTFGSRRQPVGLLFAGGNHHLCQQDSACSRRSPDRTLHLG